MSWIPNAASHPKRKCRCNRRLGVALVWACCLYVATLTSATARVLAASDSSEKQLRKDKSPERAETSGDTLGIWFLGRYLFGSWREAFFTCRIIGDPSVPGDSKFEPRWMGLIRNVFRTARNATADGTLVVREVRGTCPQVCPDLCACHSGGHDVDLIKGTCTCKGNAAVCGRNAQCIDDYWCDCKDGFVGNGYTCCGKSLMDRFFCKTDGVGPCDDYPFCNGIPYDPYPPIVLGLDVVPDGTSTVATNSMGDKVVRVRLAPTNGDSTNITGKVTLQLVSEDQTSGIFYAFLAPVSSSWGSAGSMVVPICPTRKERFQATTDCTVVFVLNQTDWSLSYQNRSTTWTLPLYVNVYDNSRNVYRMDSRDLDNRGYISAIELYIVGVPVPPTRSPVMVVAPRNNPVPMAAPPMILPPAEAPIANNNPPLPVPLVAPMGPPAMEPLAPV